MLLHNWLPKVTKKSQHKPSKTCGTFWAITTTLSVFWVILVAVDMYSFITTVHYHPHLTTIPLAMFSFSTMIQTPVALYFGRKYPFNVPCIYLAPARLVCCGNRRFAGSLVCTVFLHMSLIAVQLVCIHGTYFILAFGAVPFVITTNIAMATFCFFCMVHILAILFTLPSLWPQLGACSREQCQATLKGVTLVVLLIAMFFFTLVVASAGYIINLGTDQGSFLLAVNKVVLPLGLCLTGVILKRFTAIWWQAMLTKQDEEVNQLKIGYNAI